MLAFSNDYYGMIFRATQSVELFCAYGISTIATHYIIINESYVENGSREYVYQIKFKDKSGNEVASTKVVDFYLIDTETLEITDEKTNDWH